ncbi:MAG: non-homologous end-joining DNA ligase [Acidimicrobiia bacterium]
MTSVSHPEKVLFPQSGVTKGEVVDYYESVSARLLPHLVDRPLTLQRFPQGIAKQGFMQKNAGKGFPSFIDHFELPKQGGTVDAPVIHDLEGLVYLANQNTITFHIPAFRTTDVEHPDRLVFDLDPAEGDIDGARLAARATGDLLDSLSVPSWLMASGSKGFHVVTPLAPTVSFDQIGRFAQALAVMLASAQPDQMTVEFLKKERKGRVFVDWMRNHFGATGVAPYSLRPLSQAPIATPIDWEELPTTTPDGFDLRSFELAADPWADASPFDLSAVVARIDQLVSERGIKLPDFDRFGRDLEKGKA